MLGCYILMKHNLFEKLAFLECCYYYLLDFYCLRESAGGFYVRVI